METKKPPVTFLFLSTYDVNYLIHSLTNNLKSLYTHIFHFLILAHPLH